jgi:hypothetical protein
MGSRYKNETTPPNFARHIKKFQYESQNPNKENKQNKREGSNFLKTYNKIK